MKPLTEGFFKRDSITLARRLLGCLLVRRIGRLSLTGRIVETEAYLGLKDPSCHSFSGKRTERVKTMYLPAGRSYIYFIYGAHYCLNVVSGSTKEPEAILIRAIEPQSGLQEMRKRRRRQDIAELCRGPGKLCQALHITKALNGKRLFQEKSAASPPSLYIAGGMTAQNIEASPRIGLSPHSDSAYWPLRFFIKGSLFVSAHRGAS